MKVDSDGKPVVEVAVLVVAAVGSRNTSQPVDGQNWFVNRLGLAVDTDLLSVDALEVPHAQSQLLSANISTSSNLHNCDSSSNFRQARCGHRGDAHIGEASHPGPKRMPPTDAPDLDAVWACSMCTSENHGAMKLCEMCGSINRPRRTETGVHVMVLG